MTDLDQLAEDLRQERFDAKVEQSHVQAAPTPDGIPWDVVMIYLDDAAKAAIGALVTTIVGWAAKRRWRSKNGPDQLVHIYGPNGEVVKMIYVEGEEAHEVSTRRGLRKAARRARRRMGRRAR